MNSPKLMFTSESVTEGHPDKMKVLLIVFCFYFTARFIIY